MKTFSKAFGLLVGCGLCMATHAQPGITAISFSGTAMSPLGSWAIVPSPGYWSIRALLADGTDHPIGFLSPPTTLNTASAASYPTGFKVTLEESAPANAIIIVYRSTLPIEAGDNVERAEYGGICLPLGCSPGDYFVPISGDLLNSGFVSSGAAMPVTLQEFSVD